MNKLAGILEQLRANDGQVNSQIIRDLLAEHKPKRDKMIRLYRAYKAEELEIHNREILDNDAADNRLNNDFRAEIVDQVIGYMTGHPIQYSTSDEKNEEFLRRFIKINKIDDLDAKTLKMAVICGYAARLCYIDKNGERRVMDVPPWEAIFIKDRSLDETQYALRYYPVTVVDGGNKTIKTRVEWYDNEKITFYIDNNGGFVLDNTEELNPRPHLFRHVPLVEFLNNDEKMGDFEKVESLIDAYDRLISDAQNILEDFRSAYLVFEGQDAPDPEVVAKMKKARAISGPGKVYYLVKEINDKFLENQKETLRKNIYRFSQTLDMGDETFQSSESGEARKWRISMLPPQRGSS